MMHICHLEMMCIVYATNLFYQICLGRNIRTIAILFSKGRATLPQTSWKEVVRVDGGRTKHMTLISKAYKAQDFNIIDWGSYPESQPKSTFPFNNKLQSHLILGMYNEAVNG